MSNPQTPITQAVEQLRGKVLSILHSSCDDWLILGECPTCELQTDRIISALADTLKIVGKEVIGDYRDLKEGHDVVVNVVISKQFQRLELVVGEMKCK